jgi:hypothetical protein
MTEFAGIFEVLASDQHDARLASRKALVLARTRIDQRLGKFLTARSDEEFKARFDLVSDDFIGIIAVAATEVGADGKTLFDPLYNHYRTAGDNEYAKDDEENAVIKSQQEKRENDEAEDAEDRRKYRKDDERMAGKPPWLKDDDDDDDKKDKKEKHKDKEEPSKDEEDGDDGDETLNFSAKTATVADYLSSYYASGDPEDDVEDKAHKVQKAEDKGHLWDADDPESEEDDDLPDKKESKTADAVPLAPGHSVHTPLTEWENPNQAPAVPEPRPEMPVSGNFPCQRCGAVVEGSGHNASRQCSSCGAVHDQTGHLATRWSNVRVIAEDGNTGLGGPSPKIDKKRWTPKSVTKEQVEEPSEKHPTKRDDVTEMARPKNEGDLKEIGEKTTTRETLPTATEKDGGGFATGGEESGPHTETFSDGDQASPVTKQTVEE